MRTGDDGADVAALVGIEAEPVIVEPEPQAASKPPTGTASTIPVNERRKKARRAGTLVLAVADSFPRRPGCWLASCESCTGSNMLRLPHLHQSSG
ncbi:MAG: hypothetical protein IMW90_00990 [Thermogemmatispora sp.]|uniref:hypothetical protein n=1 Tax=Thermogemmatispora sp. TaxID=1968838 RepID=UPI0019F58A33|nr:hypothetical protein [Thermogemmatispora sp.]MBE3564283.1 hypothetical protein [Thermogemmatispora sp.]